MTHLLFRNLPPSFLWELLFLLSALPETTKLPGNLLLSDQRLFGQLAAQTGVVRYQETSSCCLKLPNNVFFVVSRTQISLPHSFAKILALPITDGHNSIRRPCPNHISPPPTNPHGRSRASSPCPLPQPIKLQFCCPKWECNMKK